MASLGSILFSIDGAVEGSACSGHRLPANTRWRKPLGSLRSCTLGSGKLTRGLRRMEGFRWGINSVSKDFDGGEYEKDSVDALQETIEKSKKVLAIQSEILQKIAERRKLLASLKNSINNPVDGSFHSDPDVSPNVRGAPDESYDIRPGSSTSSSRTVPTGASTNGHTLHRATPSTPVSSKVSLKTSGFSTSSDNQGSITEGGLSFQTAEKMDFSKNLPRTRVSAAFNGNYAYFEREQETSSLSDSGLSYSGSVVKAEEMSALPALLPNNSETSNIQHEEETSINQLTNMNDPNPADMKSSCPPAGENVMNILLVAAECAPWSKTGGLGDVAAALPKALARRGHRVMVVAPRYGNYPEAQHLGLPRRYMVNGQDFEVSYFHAYIDGVDYVFIDSDLFRGIEKNIYGGSRLDILKRMVLFCKAAIEVPWHVPCGGVCYGDGNLVFIANDWHTALLPVYLKAYYHEHGFMIFARSVLVIHNIAYQGRGPLDDFSFADLPGHYLDNFRVYDPVGGEHFNIFAAGLKFAHRIITVSHGYAWELKTQEGGWGLHNIIQENDWKLKGIVNGIDANEWNPQSDIHLQSDGYKNYSPETLNIGKPKCKTALQKELNLPARPDALLIGFIGRLDPQKGVDIIADAIPWMMGHDVQLVMLGTGNAELEQMLRHAESQHHDRVRGWVGFSVKTAHRIIAGADVLLMPSRFEPCGLNQLYAMRYGTIPVVHAVGGLRDTVAPFDPYNDSGYGWTFDMADSDKMKEALWNCLVTYRSYRQSWEGLQRRGMMQNLSWDRAAQIYEEVVVDAKFQW